MSRNWSYKPSDWWAICDSCGKKYKASELKRRWDGVMVCPADWEIRHPQDFLRSKPDKIAVPWARPQVTDTFLPLFANISETIYLYENSSFINNKPPVSKSDSVSLSENISTTTQYYRNIPLSGIQTNGSVHGASLNTLSLNSSSITYTNTTETLALTETVVVSRGFNKSISESISLTENISTFKYVANALNVWALNSQQLG